MRGAAAALILVAAVVAQAAGWEAARADEIAVTIPTRPGVTESFTFDAPAQPKAAVILFPGGQGAIFLRGAGGHPVLGAGGNFLVRSRERFVALGLAAIALDAPSDNSGGISEGFRRGADHAQDVAAVVAWLHAKVNVPVWLVGTSMGSISAASVAARLGHGIDGLVLTSSVSAAARNSPAGGVLTLDLDKIVVPTLVMDHVNDACISSPPEGADAIAKRLTSAPRKQMRMMEGGSPPQSGPCDAFSYHGYLGIEDKTVAAIAEFILAK